MPCSFGKYAGATGPFIACLSVDDPILLDKL